MLSRRWLLILVLGMGVCVASASPAVQPQASLEHVGNQVYCLCGCVTTLNRCPHLPSECESRAQMEALIRKDISQGKTDPSILQDLVKRYGVRVLASPPAQGFDLAVWILPGVGLTIGLVVVLVIVRRWRRRPPKPPQASSTPIDEKILAAVEEEMNTIGS